MGSFWDSIKSNLVYVFLGMLALNIVILDYMVFFNNPKQIIQNINLTKSGSTSQEVSSEIQSKSSAAQSPQTTASTTSCPNACTTVIKNAIASITPAVITSAPTQTSTTQTATQAQEYFIPFGSGSGTSQGTYSTLPALSSYVNTSLYSSISTITFEVSATIPNGNQSASIQLYNATGGYAIPNSQVTISGGTPQLLISPNITLPSGNNLYQVQINTQLNSPIIIDQARLHITTN